MPSTQKITIVLLIHDGVSAIDTALNHVLNGVVNPLVSCGFGCAWVVVDNASSVDFLKLVSGDPFQLLQRVRLETRYSNQIASFIGLYHAPPGAVLVVDLALWQTPQQVGVGVADWLEWYGNGILWPHSFYFSDVMMAVFKRRDARVQRLDRLFGRAGFLPQVVAEKGQPIRYLIRMARFWIARIGWIGLAIACVIGVGVSWQLTGGGQAGFSGAGILSLVTIGYSSWIFFQSPRISSVNYRIIGEPLSVAKSRRRRRRRRVKPMT